MSLNFECLIQSLRLSHVTISLCFNHALSRAPGTKRLTKQHSGALLHYIGSFKLYQKCIGHSSLQSDILIEEFVLVSEISSDDIPIYSNVRKGLATLFEYQFKLFCSEAAVFK